MDAPTEAIWRVTYISCHKLVLALNMKTNISTIFVQLISYQQVLHFISYYIGHVILNLLLRSHISTDHDRIDCSLPDVTNSQALNPNIRTYCAILSQSNNKDIDSDSPCVSCQSSTLSSIQMTIRRLTRRIFPNNKSENYLFSHCET